VGLGLVIGGLVLILLWLLLRWLNTPQSNSPWWQQRSVQSGTNALLTMIAAFVILGGINFLAVRTPGQIDFTEIKQFSLAPQTKQVLKDLKQPVKALVFAQQPDPQQRSLLEQYKRQNGERFSFEFIDPQAQPGLAEKYKIRTIGEVILETGDRTKTVEGGLTETNLTPAVASLMRDRKVNAYVVQGHGEIPLSGGKMNLDGLMGELKKRDFNVNALNLVEQKQIAEDADVLVVPGPKRTFLTSEVKLLSDYLKQGKSMVLMLDPDPEKGDKTKGLDSLLKDWGVELDGRLVVDASGSGQMLGLGPAIPLVTQYGDHPITKDFSQSPSFYPLSQAVSVKPPSADEQVTELLKTSPQSWAEGDPKQEKLAFDGARDRQGPLSLGVAITRKITPETAKVPEAKKTDPNASASPSPSPSTPTPSASPLTNEPKREAKLVVIGDSDFATVANPQVLNGDFFLNTVTWLGSGQDDPNLSIRPKEPKDRRIEMSPTTWRTLILVGLGFLPAAGFGSAVYLWWKRR
jgi:ABC-type uncharacterized transport system involved in gliding motility auxiliary subunit